MRRGIFGGIFEQDSQYLVPIMPIQNFPTGTLDPARSFSPCRDTATETTMELTFSKVDEASIKRLNPKKEW